MHLLLQTFAIPELFGFPRFEHQISSTLLNWYTLVFWLWSVLLFSFFIMVVRSNLEITDAYRRLTYLLSWFCASADKEAHHIQIASVRYTGVCVCTQVSHFGASSSAAHHSFSFMRCKSGESRQAHAPALSPAALIQKKARSLSRLPQSLYIHSPEQDPADNNFLFFSLTHITDERTWRRLCRPQVARALRIIRGRRQTQVHFAV